MFIPFALVSSARFSGDRNPPLQRARTVASAGVWFLMGVERAGGFYHKSVPSRFQPRDFPDPYLSQMITV